MTAPRKKKRAWCWLAINAGWYFGYDHPDTMRGASVHKAIGHGVWAWFADGAHGDHRSSRRCSTLRAAKAAAEAWLDEQDGKP